MHISYYAHLSLLDLISLAISDTFSFLGLNNSLSVFFSRNFNECSLHCFRCYGSVISYFHGKKALKGLISYPLDESIYISSTDVMTYPR